MPALAHESGVPTLPAAGAVAPAPPSRDRLGIDFDAEYDSVQAPLNDAPASGEGGMTMLHPGLDPAWIDAAAVAIAIIALWSLVAPFPSPGTTRGFDAARVPLVGRAVRFVNAHPGALFAAKCASVALFALIVIAGFFGTVHPEHNAATVLVWNLWWPLVIVSVMMVGSGWCAVCPWDALASWLVRRRLWRRADPHPGLNRRVPPWLRNVWPALLLFLALTWLEVGVGIVSIPFATALLALVLLALAVAFLLVFERKAFCRYACPVGRTIGYYARLAPVAVRPADQKTCDACTTRECFNGSNDVEPCPTHLTVGRFSENTHCISCGNCVYSCPYRNVTWSLRPVSAEARELSRPLADGAWFMLALLGITTFHGLTMLPFWSDWVLAIGRAVGESGRLYASFTLAMLASFALPLALYAAAIGALRPYAPRGVSYAKLFAAFAFAALPLAFAYHLAHNLHHLSRETGDLASLFLNPLGTGLAPLSPAERHQRMMSPLFPDEAMYTLQAGLMIAGFWLAASIARHRAREYWPAAGALRGWRIAPLLLFGAAVTAINLWVMAQDMEMRF